ncbi:hypothetical protein BD410DRAFT_30305 [Rickenella mellea]|uniref:Uncharacterized protein n=1 Tax=Rickenella mellea TaxID=50990 RepID=A0A4R5XEP1_9AGAM|nr:hypothetical protein BD410DRAFT_30305 [Rickenella mellea]
MCVMTMAFVRVSIFCEILFIHVIVCITYSSFICFRWTTPSKVTYHCDTFVTQKIQLHFLDSRDSEHNCQLQVIYSESLSCNAHMDEHRIPKIYCRH